MPSDHLARGISVRGTSVRSDGVGTGSEFIVSLPAASADSHPS
jgi:hypothetical protein